MQGGRGGETRDELTVMKEAKRAAAQILNIVDIDDCEERERESMQLLLTCRSCPAPSLLPLSSTCPVLSSSSVLASSHIPLLSSLCLSALV